MLLSLPNSNTVTCKQLQYIIRMLLVEADSQDEIQHTAGTDRVVPTVKKTTQQPCDDVPPVTIRQEPSSPAKVRLNSTKIFHFILCTCIEKTQDQPRVCSTTPVWWLRCAGCLA